MKPRILNADEGQQRCGLETGSEGGKTAMAYESDCSSK